MDFLNNLFAQLRDLFQSMTPGARITAGLLLVVSVVSLAFLFQQGTSGGDEYLFGGEPLSQSQLNKMTVAMSQAGIDKSDWDIEGNKLRVSHDKVRDALTAIGSAKLLPPGFSDLSQSALDDASIFSTRSQLEFRYKTTTENRLAQALDAWPWIDQATVFLDIEEGRGPNRKSHATASVMVFPQPGEMLDPHRIKEIKQFVAFSDASLSLANVQVTSGGNEDYASDNIQFDDPYLDARSKIEQSYKVRLAKELSYIPGVRIVVSGDVDNTSEKRRIENSPEGSETQREKTDSETTESTVADGGGQPGQIPNSARGPGEVAYSSHENSSKTQRDMTDTVNVIGQVQEQSLQTGFVPKAVYASIAIPSEYVFDIWQQHNPDAGPDDYNVTERTSQEDTIKTKVENYVKNVLPRLELGQDEYKQVEVVFYDQATVKPREKPSFGAVALAWTQQYWPTVSMIGLAMFSLLLLRSVTKPVAGDGESSQPTLQLDTGDASASEDDDESDEDERPRLRLKKGESLKDDLSAIVQEDPDAAAAILRSWISNAG